MHSSKITFKQTPSGYKAASKPVLGALDWNPSRSRRVEIFISQSNIQKGIEYDRLSTKITAVVAFIEFKFFKTLNVSSQRQRDDFVILAWAASLVMLVNSIHFNF